MFLFELKILSEGIPAEENDFYFFRVVQTLYGAHPASYWMGTGVLSRG
jgi:hypothetical protein